MTSPVLTVAEASAYLRVSEDVVYRLCADGTLPARRVGRCWRIAQESLAAWLAAPSLPAASAVPSASTTAAASGGPRSPAPVWTGAPGVDHPRRTPPAPQGYDSLSDLGAPARL